MISQGEERVDDLSGFGNLQAASCHAGSLHQQDIFLLSQVCIEVSIPSGRERACTMRIWTFKNRGLNASDY